MTNLTTKERANVDNVMKLFNQELDAQVLGGLTGTPVATWRERVRGWWNTKTKTVVDTTGTAL